ncbi:MAG: hypothetical protein APF84_16110 [Gracilibacter sp. BRH_c7a]|nr:MAG: hypothetical protein APF84_16110 [Gracilibacter sp. BRH_c7a]
MPLVALKLKQRGKGLETGDAVVMEEQGDQKRRPGQREPQPPGDARLLPGRLHLESRQFVDPLLHCAEGADVGTIEVPARQQYPQQHAHHQQVPEGVFIKRWDIAGKQGGEVGERQRVLLPESQENDPQPQSQDAQPGTLPPDGQKDQQVEHRQPQHFGGEHGLPFLRGLHAPLAFTRPMGRFAHRVGDSRRGIGGARHHIDVFLRNDPGGDRHPLEDAEIIMGHDFLPEQRSLEILHDHGVRDFRLGADAHQDCDGTGIAGRAGHRAVAEEFLLSAGVPVCFVKNVLARYLFVGSGAGEDLVQPFQDVGLSPHVLQGEQQDQRRYRQPLDNLCPLKLA